MLDIDLIRSSVEGNGFISEVFYFEELDSTNTYAAGKDIPLDSIVIAGHQKSGKGRFDRKWESARNENLTFSIKKILPLSPSENHFAVCFFSYYVYAAIYDELKNKCAGNEPENLFIKWPNDIMYSSKKISGILIESKLPSNEYIIGIGLNCNQKKFGPGINAGSLSNITGRNIDLNSLLISIIKNFGENFHQIMSSDFTEIFRKWKNAANLAGKTCMLDSGSNHVSNGKIIGLNFDGSISIQIGDEISNFHSGEIRITSLG